MLKKTYRHLSDNNNYRPIAPGTIISKLFESTILLKCVMFFNTCPNQFRFKKGQGTDMCLLCSERVN